VGIESDIVSMDVQARGKVGAGIVEETCGKEEPRTKLVHKTRCTKRPKKRGSRTLYNIKREEKGTGGVCVGYLLELYGTCVRSTSVNVMRGREGTWEGIF
jgi:hypothetical protein